MSRAATAMVPSEDGVELGKPLGSELGSEEDVTVAFDDLKFSVVNGKLQAAILQVKKGKTDILHGVSGRISSRHVMAIIGPSGSGKTTLLEALAQQPYLVNDKSVSITGQMRVQEGGATGPWKPLTRNFISAKCSFMPQHDGLWPALTAYENLTYALMLFRSLTSHGAGVTAAIDERVTQKLAELGLTGCRDVLVGSPFLKGLSGGQKRRLSLGCNMMKENVKVLFLDEPTSGLDAASAAEIMKLITTLAKSRGFAVLCSIHQPSSHVFYAFDQVLLLSKGRVAYYGAASGGIPYFETKGHTMSNVMNPADFLLEIVNSDFADDTVVTGLLDAWKDKEAAARDTREWKETFSAVTVVDSLAASGGGGGGGGGSSHVRTLARILVLMKRAFLCYKRDPALYLLRFCMYAFMSAFLGVTYMDVTKDQSDIPDMFFCILWMTAFFSYMGMVALPAFGLEKEVVVREITNGEYQLFDYCVATAALQLPLIFICAFLASLGPYWCPPLNPSFSRYLGVLCVFGMHLYVVESLGVFIAAIIPNFILGLIVFCSVLSQMFVFNGFFVSVENMPVFLLYPVYYTSPFAYTNQALFKLVFSGQDMSGWDKCLRKMKYPCYGETGSDVLDAISSDDLKYNDVDPWLWFAVLCIFALCFRFGFYFWLRGSVFDLRPKNVVG